MYDCEAFGLDHWKGEFAFSRDSKDCEGITPGRSGQELRFEDAELSVSI